MTSLNRLRPLVLLSIVSVVFLIIYYSVNTEPVYPLQTVTKEDITESIEQLSKQFDLNTDIKSKAPTYETRANESIGQYIAKQKWTPEEIENLTNEIPIYTISVLVEMDHFEVDPFTAEVVRASNIFYEIDSEHEVNEFIEKVFGAGFEKVNEEQNFFGEVEQIYSRGEVIGDIEEKLSVTLTDHAIIGFHKYGEVRDFQLSTSLFNFWEIILMLIFMITIVIIAIVATVQLIKRLNKNEIETFLGPFLISLLAGVGWFFGLYLAMGTVDVFSLLFTGLLTYTTFIILLITAKKADYVQPFSQIAIKLQPAVWNGFLLMLVSTVLVTIFYGIWAQFGAWTSPVMDYSIFLNTPIWALPVFALSLGICASISEETIFRRYLIPAFDRWGVIFSVIATSFLWGIGHMGYHMVPWHIRIFEFMIIVGPFFYFVYKRYGFVTAIFCHYFYNSLFGSIFLISIYWPVGILSFVLTLVPFFVFLKRSGENRGHLLFRSVS